MKLLKNIYDLLYVTKETEWELEDVFLTNKNLLGLHLKKMLQATKMFGTALLMCAAKEVIRKRIKVREGSPFTWCLLEKSYAMEGDAEALNAGQRAKMLESSYF